MLCTYFDTTENFGLFITWIWLYNSPTFRLLSFSIHCSLIIAHPQSAAAAAYEIKNLNSHLRSDYFSVCHLGLSDRSSNDASFAFEEYARCSKSNNTSKRWHRLQYAPSLTWNASLKVDWPWLMGNNELAWLIRIQYTFDVDDDDDDKMQSCKMLLLIIFLQLK